MKQKQWIELESSVERATLTRSQAKLLQFACRDALLSAHPSNPAARRGQRRGERGRTTKA